MKRSKKIYDEEKSARKKKSKSNKRRRKESLSPSSYSSEPEDDPRAHRRRKKGSTKPEKQRNESKKSGRKKSRRSSGYRRRVTASPSSGRSSSGGSTDGRRWQRRSRSPVARPDRKGKSRARTESRGRSRRRMNDKGEGIRLRSQSCSTCPSRSVSSSSRGRSPVRSGKRIKERNMKIEKSNRFLSEEMVLGNNSDKDDEKDNNTQACGNSTSSWSKDDAYEVKKLDVHPLTSQVKNTQRVVKKEECCHAEEGELVSEKLDSQPSEKANAGEDYFTKKNENPTNSVKSAADFELILRQKALENFRKFRRGASTNKAAIAAAGNEASETKDDPSKVVELRQKALQNFRKCQDGCSANRRTNIDMENEATETHDDPPEVKEMRQKALENFRKSQGGISVNSRPAVTLEKESIQTLSYNKLLGSIEAQNSGNIVRHKLTNSHAQQVRIDSDTRQSGRRLRSVVTIPEKGTSEQNTSGQIPTDISEVANMCVPDNSNACQVIHSPVDIGKPSTEGSSMKTSVDEDKHHKRIDTEVGSHATNITNINEADLQLVSEISAPESNTRHEIKEENAGSQFKEKKFSRMHDGELVQVSYKVYIPNRAPALARRKLQR